MALIKCSECDAQVSDKATACVHCGAPISGGAQKISPAAIPSKRTSGFSRALQFLIVVAALVFVVSYLSDKADDTGQRVPQVSSTPTVQQSPNEVISSPPKLPSQEAAFINIVAQAQANSRNSANDMQRGGHKAARDKQICAVLGAAQIHDWVGTVDEVNANSDGKGVLGILIAPDVRVRTWNNALSDIGDDTLIEPNAPLFSIASNLRKGQMVRFSGSFFRGSGGDCIKEMSLTLNGKLLQPEFVFKFRSVSTDLSTPSRPTPASSAQLPRYPTSPTQQAKSQDSGVAESAPVITPSFSCSKAHFLDERTICQNSELAFLDKQMASYYAGAAKVSRNPREFKQEGYQWLEKRRACQDNVVCMKRLYADRIDELSRLAEK